MPRVLADVRAGPKPHRKRLRSAKELCKAHVHSHTKWELTERHMSTIANEMHNKIELTRPLSIMKIVTPAAQMSAGYEYSGP